MFIPILGLVSVVSLFVLILLWLSQKDWVQQEKKDKQLYSEMSVNLQLYVSYLESKNIYLPRNYKAWLLNYDRWLKKEMT